MRQISRVSNRLQPLVKRPNEASAVISDLFLWRASDEWKTYFDLVNLLSLFSHVDACESTNVKIVLFDNQGSVINDVLIDVNSHAKKRVDVSALVGSQQGEYGSFAVFHHKTPEDIQAYGSFISDRGYVSYQYKNSLIRSYVHGNLDAIACSSSGEMEYVAGTSVFKREFQLQSRLGWDHPYQLALTNPVSKAQQIEIIERSLFNFSDLVRKKITVSSGGSIVYDVESTIGLAKRVVIKSQMVMARPIIFRLEKEHCEVFHG